MRPGVDAPHVHSARQRPAWTMRPGGRTLRARCTRSSLMLGVLVLAAVVSTRWVRVNVSPSAPLGLYRLEAVTPPLTRGTLVVLPVPPVVQRWHSAWLPLLKPIAALPGDLVCTSEAGLWIEGWAYGPVYPEAGGAPLPRLQGCVRVPAGAVFLASPAPRSLDGRYFGVTAVATLTAQAVPVWTWNRSRAGAGGERWDLRRDQGGTRQGHDRDHTMDHLGPLYERNQGPGEGPAARSRLATRLGKLSLHPWGPEG